jgi:hypothetical protein
MSNEENVSDRLRAVEECLADMARFEPPKRGDSISYKIREILSGDLYFVRIFRRHQQGRGRYVSDASIAILGAAVGGALVAYVSHVWIK